MRAYTHFTDETTKARRGKWLSGASHPAVASGHWMVRPAEAEILFPISSFPALWSLAHSKCSMNSLKDACPCCWVKALVVARALLPCSGLSECEGLLFLQHWGSVLPRKESVFLPESPGG